MQGNTFNGPTTIGTMHTGSGDIRQTAVHRDLPRPGSEFAPTVGIVTALPEEHAAVYSMLDDVFPPPPAADGVPYDAGTMPSRRPGNPHRVVLTALTQGGNTVAATAFTNLVRSFPSVGYVVMSGIAAGVPNPGLPREHVRLGDIVVATWGVVDYDHVDVRVDGRQQRAGFPKPSVALQQADGRLASAEYRGERPWEQWLDAKGTGAFARPDESTDVLHSSDESGRILTHPRTERPGRPRVHRGLIGSADWSLRDARVRDELARRCGVRAIEMEGQGIGNAGFLNHRQWFVVRGISDYGDSRTTPVWRTYASLVAAAYVRALLAQLEPTA